MRLTRFFSACVCAIACSAQPALAQGIVSNHTIPAPRQPGAIPLSVDGKPADNELWHFTDDAIAVRNVTVPTLMPVLPARDTDGTAVIIAPGGAFLGLAIEKEGWDVARWFANHGVAAFVLKYRVLPTPADQAEFAREVAKVRAGKPASFRPPEDTPPQALADALAALRHVRKHAVEYGVDPARVGFMGFSAGGFLTRTVIENAGEEMPAFAAPIYPNMGSMTVPANAPPMFVAIALADFLLQREHGLPLIDSYRQAKKSIELHLFSEGGHAFGIGRSDTATELWPDLMLAWLRDHGFARERN